MHRSWTVKFVVVALGGAALLGVSGGMGSAATAARPSNTSPPTITGTAVEGSVLSGHLGTWSGNPTDFNTWWRRCDRNGHHCGNITGSGGSSSYRVSAADEGHRLRFSVGAANHDGRTWTSSSPTAVVPASRPAAVSPPTISGNPFVGATLTGSSGRWSGNPTDFNSWWQRCSAAGTNCANLAGTGGRARYRVTSYDAGSTLRYAVGAANAQGRTWTSSAQTAVITAGAPPARTGCPSTTSPDDVAAISPPARLILDGIQAPSIVTRQTKTLILRFHVSSTCGGSVRNAHVYVTAAPFFQFAVPPEQLTGSDGWAEVQMQRLSGFPVSPRQGLIALFVRARKAGEDPLGGISTRRLFSVRVNLHA
jgi:hypothetical protein